MPPALAPYAASLDYGADVVTLPVRAARVTFSIGAALKQGLGHARPAEWDEAVHALHYLVRQLPTATQAATAQCLLAPSRPLLVRALAVQGPGRPDDLARLIALSAPVTLRRD